MCENFLDLGGLQLVEPRGYELWLCRLWPDIGLGSYPRHTTLQHANVGTLQYLLAILGATVQLSAVPAQHYVGEDALPSSDFIYFLSNSNIYSIRCKI